MTPADLRTRTRELARRSEELRGRSLRQFERSRLALAGGQKPYLASWSTALDEARAVYARISLSAALCSQSRALMAAARSAVARQRVRRRGLVRPQGSGARG